jgi:hypothetical protein
MHVTPHLRPAALDARELVVVVHGQSKRILDSVPGVVADERPHADVLTPTYEAGWLSNADPGYNLRLGTYAHVSYLGRAWRTVQGGDYRRAPACWWFGWAAEGTKSFIRRLRGVRGLFSKRSVLTSAVPGCKVDRLIDGLARG